MGSNLATPIVSVYRSGSDSAHMSCAVAQIHGRRLRQEDRHIMAPFWSSSSQPTANVGLFAVLDGHESFETAEYLRHALPFVVPVPPPTTTNAAATAAGDVKSTTVSVGDPMSLS
jgi:serine/threonine protein phosphatase PrpC